MGAMAQMRQDAQVVIVTGVTAGIGKACAEHLVERGYRVYGGARRVPPAGEETLAASGQGFLRSWPLDVTDPAAVEAFVQRVVDTEGGVAALVHAAGYTLAGAVEDVAPEEARQQFDTNLFGAHNLFRAVLPVMRRQGAGRLIVIGSVAGLFPVPFQAMYSASKYALGALTEATRMEVAPFGVKVTIIEPGDVRSEFTAARRWAAAAEAEASGYHERCRRAVDAMIRSEQAGPGPDIVVRAVDRVLHQSDPPVRVVVGAQYKLFGYLKPLLPLRAVHGILSKMYG